jgi:ribosomal protein S13
MDKQRAKNIVRAYLEMDNVHYGLKVKRLEEQEIITYDGDYNLIEIIYDGSISNLTNKIDVKTLSDDIGRYTGLRHKRDFWIGITSEK